MQERSLRLMALTGLTLSLLTACADSAATQEANGSMLQTDSDPSTAQTEEDASALGEAIARRWRWPRRDAGTSTRRDAQVPPSTSDAGTPTTTTDAGTGTGTGSGGDGSGSWTGMRVGTNFWFLATWGENAWAPNVNFATTDNPWNPTFLADLKEANYAAYRFMDFGGTNESTIRNWSERTQKTSQDNLTAGEWHGRGIAYEWMFDLCNRMHKDCWITVPHLAIESYEQNPQSNYFTELAKLAKATLDPSLTLYIEYSNETWNGGFAQSTYAQQRGVSAGYDTQGYGASFKFHVYASARMYDAFMSVYGGETGRVRWVVSGQLFSAYGTTMQIEALRDPSINPFKRMPHYHAISSYVGADGSVDGASPDMPAQWRAALDDTFASASEQAQLLLGTGMKLIAYEGGQHITNHTDAFARNQVAYDLYTEWLDKMSSLYALNMHYAHSGKWDPGNAWGSKEFTGQPVSQAPKSRALVDYIKAH